jgi:hypothetical protein
MNQRKENAFFRFLKCFKRSSRLLLALAALIHVAMLVGWRWQMPLVPYFFDSTVLSGGRGLDFYSIYQAGYNARSGVDIYEGDPAKIQVVVPYFTPYRYLPIVAYTVGLLLSLFSSLTAYKLWVVIIELTLLLCVLITYRRARDPDLFARLACMWLCFTPFYLELFMGQFSLVQGALIFGMLLTAEKKQATKDEGQKTDDGRRTTEEEKKEEVSANSALSAVNLEGLWITSVLWKINTIIFIPVFVRLRRFRAIVIAIIIVAATTIPYFLIFPAHWHDFIANNFGNGVTSHELGNLGLRQFIFECLAALNASPTLQRFAQPALISIIIGLALALTFYLPPPTFHLPSSSFIPHPSSLLSLWLLAFFLISPQIWEHHYVMLLPVLVNLYRQKPNWVVGLIWLALALPTPFGFIGLQPVIAANHDLRAFPLEPVWQPLLQHASKALPTLVLFIYVSQGIVRRDA